MPTAEELKIQKEAADKAAKEKKQDPPGEDDAANGEEGDPGDDSGSKNAGAADDKGNAKDPGGWTAEQKAYIEGLRKESGKYRTKSKDLESKYTGLESKFSKIEKGLKGLFGEGEGEEVDPEKQVESLTQALQAKDIQHSITELAYEHSIPKEDKEYFEYLMMKKLGTLKEDEELGDEDIEEIAKQAKARKGPGSSSVGTGSKPGAEGNGNGQVTVAQFKKMSITEKSALYGKDSKLYESLLAQSKENRQTV